MLELFEHKCILSHETENIKFGSDTLMMKAVLLKEKNENVSNSLQDGKFLFRGKFIR